MFFGKKLIIVNESIWKEVGLRRLCKPEDQKWSRRTAPLSPNPVIALLGQLTL